MSNKMREIINSFNQKNVDSEFELYKNSTWNRLPYTLDNIVKNWNELQYNENDNIQTIKYFVENPSKITCLSYDKKGLADGYHRLVALKILGIKHICFTYEDTYSGD